MNTTKIGNISGDQLKNLVESIERLENNKNQIMEDIREIYKTAKSQGFDSGTIRKIVKLRKMDNEKLEEEDFLLDLYRKTLGV